MIAIAIRYHHHYHEHQCLYAHCHHHYDDSYLACYGELGSQNDDVKAMTRIDA